ncbi:Z1 domain-containing protein [Bacteroides heparinolyticus]|uniref:Z1 domain-containing protein n=1 Tax=Prevotella heparinolytica TaxID=28113 RepID=UPI0035A07921
MTEDQYLILRQTTFLYISADKSVGKEVKFENINSYIERGTSLFPGLCDDEVKKRLFTDIEYQFKITHAKGNVIFDNYDDERNWYSNDNVKEPFFWSRYKSLLYSNHSFNRTSITLMDEDTLPNIMNCLGNPKEHFGFRRGLVIGDVQSGKTATYSGLICKAADAGYKVVILLAGITESLRQQTQERIDESIVGITKKKMGKQVITETVGVGKDNKGIRATSFTSCVKDFTGDHDKITMSLDSQKSLVLFVIKKNVSVLRKLHDWLKDQNLDPIKRCIDIPMLIIDDEADNASVNTKKDETDPTKTNKLIRQICMLFKDTTYVGFTATPFANVFIDPDSVDSMKNADLFPEHFIYALDAPSNYVGAQKIFYPEGQYYHNLRYITDIEEPDYTSEEYLDQVDNDIDSLNSGGFYYRHKKEWDGELPASLTDAIYCFYLANAIRDLRGQHSAPRSMLINMSRFIKVQRVITEHVEHIHEKVFDDIRFNFTDNNKENSQLPLYQIFEKLWKKHFSHVTDITFDRVVQKQTIMDAIEKIKVMVVNGSKQSNSLDYRANKSLRVIAVGGLALSRGLTLEGLLVSYFYRNTSTFDVLMQMGRWFGYRNGYDDIFQIWTSQTSAEWYAEIARSSQELKDNIKNMYDQRLTPKDFGIKVRDNCNELQITASNKMRAARGLDLRYSFYGNIYDTPYVSFNIEHNRNNLKETATLISSLFRDGYILRYTDLVGKATKNVNDTSDSSSRFFENIPKEIIIAFIEKIKCSMANGNFNVPNILEFLKDAENTGIENWDVVIEGGESKEHVQFNGLQNIRCVERSIYYGTRNVVQISSRRRALSGSAEGKYALTKEQIKCAEDEHRRGGGGENTPLKAYFEFLPTRKPIFIIMPIHPVPAATGEGKEENQKLTKFREELGNDHVIAFAIGLPGVKGIENAVHYKINKVYQRLNVEDAEEEEVDDAD